MLQPNAHYHVSCRLWTKVHLRVWKINCRTGAKLFLWVMPAHCEIWYGLHWLGAASLQRYCTLKQNYNLSYYLFKALWVGRYFFCTDLLHVELNTHTDLYCRLFCRNNSVKCALGKLNSREKTQILSRQFFQGPKCFTVARDVQQQREGWWFHTR